MIRRLAVLVLLTCLLASCEKQESALVLPPATGATYTQINTGEKSDWQVYYDFETNSVVYTGQIQSWDIALEATPDGRHIFLNGGNSIYVHNTHQQDMQQVTALSAGLYTSGSGWSFDSPSGMPDSTAIGEWCDGKGVSKGEVFLIQVEANIHFKVKILKADEHSYTLEWATLAGGAAPATIVIPKNAECNYTYFSFAKGVVKAEPPKTTWDLVFTKYGYVYPKYINDTTDFPYVVRGALLNPYNTSAAADSVNSFDQINLQAASDLPTTKRRDVIGFDWKTVNISQSTYQVNRRKNYIIHTQKGQMYKMHFLDYVNSAGVNGYPSFEHMRLK